MSICSWNCFSLPSMYWRAIKATPKKLYVANVTTCV